MAFETNKDNPAHDPFLRIGPAANYLGISVATLWRRVAVGALPRPHKIGPGTSGFRLSELNAFLAEMIERSAKAAA